MEYLTLEVRDQVGVVTIARPPVNAMNRQMYGEFREMFGGFGDQSDVHAVVLRSGCDRAFLAGADLKERLQERAPTTPFVTTAEIDPQAAARECFWAVYDCAVPVIAAVGGAALGAGLAVVACCDAIMATPKAQFGLTEIDVGLLGGSAFLSRLVGPMRARRAFYTAERLTAEELHAHGAVAEVVEPDRLDAAATALAAQIAAKSPTAVRLAKASFNRIEPMALKEAYRTEQDYTMRLRAFAESADYMAAFFERGSDG
jgi:enoyl-CoA hydratase